MPRTCVCVCVFTVTGQTLRCDVYISHIQSIQILTTTHQIFTDDPPLQLSVQALDSKGVSQILYYTTSNLIQWMNDTSTPTPYRYSAHPRVPDKPLDCMPVY